MKKDSTYSIRINRFVLEALKRAAKKERRTVASLLDKIILDYLEKEWFLPMPDFGEERRRFQRMMVTLPANSIVKVESNADTFPTVILNISIGGVLVTYPKGYGIKITSLRELSNFELSFTLPHTDDQLQFLCDARRIIDAPREIKIGATFKNPNEEDLRKLQTYIM